MNYKAVILLLVFLNFSAKSAFAAVSNCCSDKTEQACAKNECCKKVNPDDQNKSNEKDGCNDSCHCHQTIVFYNLTSKINNPISLTVKNFRIKPIFGYQSMLGLDLQSNIFQPPRI